VGTSGRLWRRRCLGIIACATAAGPIAVATAVARHAVTGSIHHALHYTQDLSIARLFLVCAVLAALSVPAFAIYAYVVRRLCIPRQATMVAAIACAAVLYPSLIAIGAVALGVSLRQDNWIELLMAVPGGVILGALYWLLAGRAEVQAEQERRQDARAIAAMD
jgi:hypothetical protein